MELNYELSREFECYAAVVEASKLFKEIHEVMADIPGLVRTVSAGASTLQKLADIAMQTQNVELREGILSVREELVNIKESLLEVREENLDLKEKNQKLEARIAELESPTVEELVLEGKFYFAQDGRGPYCPQCWEKRKEKNLLNKVGLYTCSANCGFKSFSS